MSAEKSEVMRREQPSDRHRHVFALEEKLRILAPDSQNRRDHLLLQSTFRVDSMEVVFFVQPTVQHAEIHRPPIVRVDKAEIQRLRTLIDVGYSRRGHLRHRLRERVYRPGL